MLSLPSLLAVSTVPLLPRACDAKTDPAKGYPAAVKKLSKALAIAGSCPESTVMVSKASRAPHYACATCRSFCLIASASLFLAIRWRSEAHSSGSCSQSSCCVPSSFAAVELDVATQLVKPLINVVMIHGVVSDGGDGTVRLLMELCDKSLLRDFLVQLPPSKVPRPLAVLC